jgi:hypothetical protein
MFLGKIKQLGLVQKVILIWRKLLTRRKFKRVKICMILMTHLQAHKVHSVVGSLDNPSGTSTSTSTRRKKGKKSDPVFMQLVDNLSNMGKVYEGATESMKKFVETFKHEADGADRRMKVYEELIFAGGGLTDKEIVKVGGIITADCNKTDYFFTLGGHFKKLYVYSLLQKKL